MALCMDPQRNHRTGSFLISDILFLQTLPGCTAYDILALPMYNTQAEHVTNYALLRAELARPLCTCANKVQALALVNAAWASIATVALRAVYDNVIDTVPPLRLVMVQRGSFPSRVRWPSSRIIAFQAPMPNPGYPVNHGLSKYFRGVEYCPGTYFYKLDRTIDLLYRRPEYSFWFALALSMCPSEHFWPTLKDRVLDYMDSVMSRLTEPRCEIYWSLSFYAYNKYHPMGRLSNQVLPDDQIGMGPTPYTLMLVTPELWQIVADALKIELFIIIAHIPPNRPALRQHKTVITRGDPRNRQVFLFLEEDGEYRAVRPHVERAEEYRFTSHHPPIYANAPRTALITRQRADAQYEADLRMSPIVETDYWGIPTHLDPPVGGPAIPPTGIHIYTPGTPPPYPRWIAPFTALEPIFKEANPRDRGAGTLPAIDRHLNPSSGRWI